MQVFHYVPFLVPFLGKVALASVGRVDVMVSWNFKHIVNLNRIRLFNAVNFEQGYSLIEIRTPKEVLYEE